MRHHDVHRLPMSDPGDVSEVAAAIDRGQLDPGDIVGIISQPEGTGHARALTMLQLSLLLADHLGEPRGAVLARVPMMMIGLTGGLMSPHHTILTRREDPTGSRTGGPRLAIGVGSTRDLHARELGTVVQAQLVAEAVRAAIEDGQLESEDVQCVEVKCPAVTPDRARALAEEGRPLPGGSLGAASSASKAASALGIAAALGEIDAAAVTDSVINNDRSLHTLRGSVSAGGEQTAARVLVLGNSTASTSSLRAGRGVMRDQLDIAGVLDALHAAGMDSPTVPLDDEHARRVRQVFINCGADMTSETRGRRHTMLSDFLAGHAGVVSKAVANAVVASVVGDPMILCSAGAEHQGPPGSNLVTAIVEVADA